MFVSARDFHQIYHNCFVEALINNSSEIKEEMFTLLLNDKEAGITESMLKIHSLIKDVSIFNRLKIASLRVKNGEAFWTMFTYAPNFATVEKVKTLCLKRIKELQDDISKNLNGHIKANVTKRQALETFLEGALPEDKPTVVPIRPPAPQGYFKPGGDRVADVRLLANEKSIPTIKGNMYSEKDIDSNPPAIADSLRAIRDTFAARAGAGVLIRERMMVEKNPHNNTIAINLAPVDTNVNPLYPYSVTLGSLLYNEVKNGRVKNREEAVRFMIDQLQNNPLFRDGQFDLNEMMQELPKILHQFNDAFAVISQTAPQKS